MQTHWSICWICPQRRSKRQERPKRNPRIPPSHVVQAPLTRSTNRLLGEIFAIWIITYQFQPNSEREGQGFQFVLWWIQQAASNHLEELACRFKTCMSSSTRLRIWFNHVSRTKRKRPRRVQSTRSISPTTKLRTKKRPMKRQCVMRSHWLRRRRLTRRTTGQREVDPWIRTQRASNFILVPEKGQNDTDNSQLEDWEIEPVLEEQQKESIFSDFWILWQRQSCSNNNNPVIGADRSLTLFAWIQIFNVKRMNWQNFPLRIACFQKFGFDNRNVPFFRLFELGTLCFHADKVCRIDRKLFRVARANLVYKLDQVCHFIFLSSRELPKADVYAGQILKGVRADRQRIGNEPTRRCSNDNIDFILLIDRETRQPSIIGSRGDLNVEALAVSEHIDTTHISLVQN